MNKLEHKFQALLAQNSNLKTQNQTLRIKSKKIHEIQSYVTILINSNSQYQTQVQSKDIQNMQLKNKVNQLMGDMIRIQKTYEDQFQQLERSYKIELSKKQQQLRQSNMNRQKENHLYEEMLDETQIRAKSQIERIKIQFGHLQEDTDIQMKKITQTLIEKNKDFQRLDNSRNQLRRSFLEQAKNLNHELGELSKAYNQIKNQNVLFSEQISKLTYLLKKSQEQQQRLTKQSIRAQDELGSQIRNLNQKISKLQKEVNELNKNQQKISQKMNNLMNQLERSKQQNIQLTDENYSYKLKQNKLNNFIQEKDRQLTEIMAKKNQDQNQFKRISKRNHQQLMRAEEELSLSNQRFSAEKRANNIKTTQIQDLISVCNNLQQSLCEIQHAKLLSDQQNQVLFKQVQDSSKKLIQMNDQVSLYNIKMRQLNQNYILLEQMHSKQLLKARQLEKQNKQLFLKHDSIIKEQNKLIEEERNLLIDAHLRQKRQIIEMNKIECEGLVRKYESAIKEKDVHTKKMFQLFEDQINLIRIKN